MPSPFLEDGQLTPSAERGEKIFESAGCVHCHIAPLFTDLEKHLVGQQDPVNPNLQFDTPTLVEIWRTAPYLFDGRAATIKDIFTQFNPQDKHGETLKLSEKELDDLVEYVLSL